MSPIIKKLEKNLDKHFQTKNDLSSFYNGFGDFMKVKIFDESHEKDLEREINDFLSTNIHVLEIHYSVSTSIFSEEQIFCFSALILYE